MLSGDPSQLAPVPEFPRAQSPADLGVAPESLDALADRLAADCLGVDSLLVLSHGSSLLERYWRGRSPLLAHHVYSVTKSFTSTAVGMAGDEGLMSVDEPVLSFFPTYATATVRANIGTMTLRHLLTMSSGHDPELWGAMKEAPEQDWVRMFLEKPLDAAPGARFAYSSANTHLAASALANRTGRTLAEFLAPRLFAPLGIAPPRWDADSRGVSEGGRGLWLRTAELAAFGQFLLDRGRWHDRRLVSESWLDLATAAHIDDHAAPEREWRQGYGFGFWRGLSGTFRADGAFGQYAVVHPPRKLVIAVTADSGRTPEILAAVHDFIEDESV